jgi:hypothetical protein
VRCLARGESDLPTTKNSIGNRGLNMGSMGEGFDRYWGFVKEREKFN